MRKQAVVIIVGLMLAMTAQIPVVMMSTAKETPRISSTQTEDALKVDIKASFGGVALTFSNTGVFDITNLTWKIALKKATIFFSKDLKGSIEKISPGQTVTVKTGLILGFALPFLVPGRMNGNITVNYDYNSPWEESKPSCILVIIIIIIIIIILVSATPVY